MKYYLGILTALTFALVGGIIGCSSTDETSEDTEGDLVSANPIAVDVGDEESAVQLALTDTYDSIRAGAHLILNYDAATNSFKGTVKNTTGAILPRVRVEVHLSNGVELGPTTPVDLAPGAQIPVTLIASGPPFDKWTAHPEVGSEGGGEGGEGGGEHGGGGEGGEGGGEHGGGGGHN
ncbi:MAG: hypothetical protein OXU36_20055 [Candidatus Poribacteria bacterium]|nr:hypothetical protein [Candidatus Poribacteria bacterium]